jgi:hypothetical protein
MECLRSTESTRTNAAKRSNFIFQNLLRPDCWNYAAAIRLCQGAAAADLVRIIVDPNAPDVDASPSCRYVLDHAAMAIEVEDIESRLAVLELPAGQNGQGL